MLLNTITKKKIFAIYYRLEPKFTGLVHLKLPVELGGLQPEFVRS